MSISKVQTNERHTVTHIGHALYSTCRAYKWKLLNSICIQIHAYIERNNRSERSGQRIVIIKYSTGRTKISLGCGKKFIFRICGWHCIVWRTYCVQCVDEMTAEMSNDSVVYAWKHWFGVRITRACG